MSEKLFSPKCLKLYLGMALTLTVIVGMIYVLRIQDIPDPKVNLMSDFAIYFSGLLVPIFTFFSVIALVTTLYYQRLQLKSQHDEFEQQQKMEYFQLLMLRFDLARQEFEKILNEPFNHSRADDAISLNYIFYIQGNEGNSDLVYKKTNKILNLLEKIDYSVTQPDQINDSDSIYFLFIAQVRAKGLALIHIFEQIDSLSQLIKVEGIRNSLNESVQVCIKQLHALMMLSDDEANEYFIKFNLPCRIVRKCAVNI